ncbi:MAG: hypothetical protein KDK70_25500, partial [Myxococcales bacterium]|nr:hypothetical protein [Myxococcales bacterium]
MRAHTGAYPAGGLGSEWDQTDALYLAGKAGLAPDPGSWWWKIFVATGLLEKPPGISDYHMHFKSGYENDHLYVKKWLFNSKDPQDWSAEWTDFKDYVESRLWSPNPRPVALGWSHTRTIVGSNGTDAFLANSSGGSYEKRTWESLKQQVIDHLSGLADSEIADVGYGTGIFKAPLRSLEKRRGVITLRPGALRLRRAEGDIRLSQIWDGRDPHAYGYYYAAPGSLGETGTLGEMFRVSSADVVEYVYQVQNTTFEPQGYDLRIRLFARGSKLTWERRHPIDNPKHRNLTDAEVWTRTDLVRDTFGVHWLPSGRHRLELTLFQGGVEQDRRHILFETETSFTP